MKDSGYREHDHTADWELEVWAPNLDGLLEQAARGMDALAGTILQPEPRLHKTFGISAQDEESLLVKFLQELLYCAEMENTGYDVFNLSLKDLNLLVDLDGAAIVQRSKEIKAVTYHNLSIIHDDSGLRARIVFDV